MIYFQRDATLIGLFISGKLLYMFRVVSPLIIRSTQLHLQYLVLVNRYCYLPLLWESWSWPECGVRIVPICFGAAADVSQWPHQNTVFPRDMVCLRNICINTLHKGDDDDDDNNNNNKSYLLKICLKIIILPSASNMFIYVHNWQHHCKKTSNISRSLVCH